MLHINRVVRFGSLCTTTLLWTSRRATSFMEGDELNPPLSSLPFGVETCCVFGRRLSGVARHRCIDIGINIDVNFDIDIDVDIFDIDIAINIDIGINIDMNIDIAINIDIDLYIYQHGHRYRSISVSQDTKRKKALDELGFDWGDDALYLHFQWPEVLISFYSVMVRLTFRRYDQNHLKTVYSLIFSFFFFLSECVRGFRGV